MDDGRTIYALSSGRPPAAIAVVRISGARAFEAVETLGARLGAPRQLVLRNLHDPRDGKVLDQALVTWFPANASVTGEDLVELHLHGGPATVAAVEVVLAELDGLRAAAPGEFTFRAFYNGNLDLIQVEGLSDLLRAETQSQRRVALAANGGGFSEIVREWQSRLLRISAIVEAQLDHSDEDDVARLSQADTFRLAEALATGIAACLDRPTTERLFDGVRVAVAGPPNAGKSTLINALAQRDAAIVSPIAGTTRDVIEVPVRLGGVAFILIDTAGLRDETMDEIEKLGIERARKQVALADIVLWLGDDAAPENAIQLFPRCDEPGRKGKSAPDRIRVSALTGFNMNHLATILIGRASALLPGESEIALTRRQKACASSTLGAIRDFLNQADLLLGAEHLRNARRHLDQLTGKIGTEELLGEIFSTFCVGK